MSVNRYAEGADPHLDMFNFRVGHELEGLGGSDAALRAEGVDDSIQTGGVNYDAVCNCSTPIAFMLTWAELYSIANGVSPYALGVSEGTEYRVADKGFSPIIPCQHCRNPIQVWVTVNEARSIIDKARAARVFKDDESMLVEAKRRIAYLAQKAAAQR